MEQKRNLFHPENVWIDDIFCEAIHFRKIFQASHFYFTVVRADRLSDVLVYYINIKMANFITGSYFT